MVLQTVSYLQQQLLHASNGQRPPGPLRKVPTSMNVYRRHYHRIKALYTQSSEKRMSGHKSHSIIQSCVFGFVNHSITLLGLLFFFLD